MEEVEGMEGMEGVEGMEGWRGGDGGDGGVEGIATRVLVRACTISDESVSRCMRASILVRACVQWTCQSK